MSVVHFIVVKNNELFFVSGHYRIARKILDNDCDLKNPVFLDAGYVVVDFDRKIVFNSQSAFHLKSSFDVFSP